MTELQQKLFELQDMEYRDFHSRLMPTIDKERIIGIRTPVLRKFAADFARTGMAASFLEELPHYYYEENNLHMMILCGIKDYNECLAGIQKFLPYIDNWATCDLISPKVLISQPEALLQKIEEWMASDHPYTIRFGMEMLMRHFLDERFDKIYLDWVAEKRSDEYYVNMMIAWFFATALAKQYEATLPYLENRVLDIWTHNKTIQKAVESYRITPEQKTYLRGLRVKNR